MVVGGGGQHAHGLHRLAQVPDAQRAVLRRAHELRFTGSDDADDGNDGGEDDDDKKSGKGPSTVVIALIVGFSSLLIGLVVGKFCFAAQEKKYEFKQSSMLG